MGPSTFVLLLPLISAVPPLTYNPLSQLDEYLDVAAGVKELHLNNAFVDLTLGKDEKAILDGTTGEEGKNRAGGNEPPEQNGEKIDYGKGVVPEKSGGGV
jgi:hypothetical protein